MISHKFREVTAFADEVSILRRGRICRRSARSPISRHSDMAAMMIGEKELVKPARPRRATRACPSLSVSGARGPPRSLRPEGPSTSTDLTVKSRRGRRHCRHFRQPLEKGEIRVKAEPYHARRDEARKLNVRYLPEEPLKNACAPTDDAWPRTSSSVISTSPPVAPSSGLMAAEMLEQARPSGRRVQGEDRLATVPDRLALRRQCPACGSCPRTDRRRRSSDHHQSLLRARLLRRCRNPRPHHGRTECRRRSSPDL
jgi:hypothetical protein